MQAYQDFDEDELDRLQAQFDDLMRDKKAKETGTQTKKA